MHAQTVVSARQQKREEALLQRRIKAIWKTVPKIVKEGIRDAKRDYRRENGRGIAAIVLPLNIETTNGDLFQNFVSVLDFERNKYRGVCTISYQFTVNNGEQDYEQRIDSVAVTLV